jgi:uncharacterized protein YecE (DUF72 family)
VLTPALEAAMADRVLQAVEPLARAGRLGAFLLQLSPGFSPKTHELSELDALLRRFEPHVVAVELRHRGWMSEARRGDTLAYLEDRGAAFVAVDAPPGEQLTIMPPVDAVTTDRLAYLRAHGRNQQGYVSGRSVPERFGWQYSDAELRQIRDRVGGLADGAERVHVLFNNNSSADAPDAARRFRQLLGQDPGPPARDGQLELTTGRA